MMNSFALIVLLSHLGSIFGKYQCGSCSQRFQGLTLCPEADLASAMGTMLVGQVDLDTALDMSLSQQG